MIRKGQDTNFIANIYPVYFRSKEFRSNKTFVTLLYDEDHHQHHQHVYFYQRRTLVKDIICQPSFTEVVQNL